MAKRKISYSKAIAEIEETVALIESEDLDVDELSDKVKRVSELLAICKDKLYNTEQEVEKIINEIDK